MTNILNQTKKGDTSLFVVILLFTIFVAPVKLQTVKSILLFVIIFFQIFFYTKRKPVMKIDDSIILYIIIYLLMNIYFLLKGVDGDFQLFKKLAVSTFIAPALLSFVIVFNKDLQSINLNKILRICLNFISFYTILYMLLHSIGLITWKVSPILGTQINYDGGYFYYFSQNITSLFFLLPYFITKTLNNKENNVTKSELKKDIFSVVVGIIIVLLVGRRSLLILVCLTPFIVYFFKNIKKPMKLLSLLFVSLLALILLLALLPVVARKFNLNLDKFSNLEELFDIGPERIEQFNALINNLIKNNFFGAGLGVNAEGSIRSNIPGAYELTYIAYLFAFGVIGFIVLMSFYIFIFSKSVKVISRKRHKHEILFPLLVGVIIIMVAAISNPYLANFDYCWLPLFPLAFVSKRTLNGRKVI